MSSSPTHTWPTKVATLALPSREAHVAAMVWPSAAGSLLFLAELNLAPPARHELAAELTNALSRAWSSGAGVTGDLEQALERLLLDLNPLLAARERLWGNPLAPRYHLALALVRGTRLALSTVGHGNVLVVAPDRITNILAAAHGSTPAAHPKPTFAQLIGGELGHNEILLLATSSLFDYLPPERLRQLLGGRAPGQGLRELEQVVATLPHHPALGAIALGLASPAAAEGTQPSLERLLKTESDTSSLITPTLWTGMRRLFARRSSTPPVPPGDELLEQQPAVPTPLRSHWWQVPGRWYGQLKLLWSKLAWLRSRESAKATVAWWLEARFIAWRRLPRGKQVALALAAIVLITFSQNLVSAGRARLASQDHEQYNELLASITERQAAAEGALIYHDDTRAQALLTETEALLQQLPHAAGSRQQQYEALQASLTLLRGRLERRVTITNLTPWATLPISSDWGGLVDVGTTLVAYRTSGAVAALNAEGIVAQPTQLPHELGSITAAYAEGANALFRSAPGTLATFDPKSRTAATINKPPQLIDAAWYEGRLYYLTADAPRTIFRTSRQGTSLATPARWLRASQGELAGAVSLTVDGAIYVAYDDRVEKYVTGTKRDFTLQQPNPPLQHIKLVRTTSEGDYLYVVTPKDRRIVVYDKQGKLVVQLAFPDSVELSDFAVDGQNRYLYILSGQSIFRLKVLDYVSS